MQLSAIARVLGVPVLGAGASVLGWGLTVMLSCSCGCRTTQESTGKAWVGTVPEGRSAPTVQPIPSAPLVDEAVPDTAERPGGTRIACGHRPGQLFPPGAAFNTPVARSPIDAESSTIIRYLADQHRARQRFQLDFSLHVLAADRQTPRRPFLSTSDFFTPDCDSVPPPLPTRGALEGERGYACRGDGDCHLLVVDLGACRLYEMWRANIQGDVFHGGCLAVWDLSRVYPPQQRGDQCTSADASGLPIAPLLFTPDDLAKGEIRHALRFILPNRHIRRATYVRPATHSTTATSGPDVAPPYGARLRLKASADLDRLTPAARVVARALQEYGMILVDGGEVTFTAASDAYSAHTWGQVGLGAHDLQPLGWSDFEVVEGGTRYHFEASCRRTPLTQ
jgi:hypothetical protein